MSDKSNNQGRGYEYINLITLHDAINELRPAEIKKNSSFKAAQHAWNTLSDNEKSMYEASAKSVISTLFAMEPKIIERGDDTVLLCIQTDKNGAEGDIRDIIIERSDIVWEIGLSLKHNNTAVKHSRLARSLDFGEKWYGRKCSEEYWNEVKPVFDYLEAEKEKGTYFRDLPAKEDDVYVPLLTAFMNEVSKQIEADRSVPGKLVGYLLSKYDFYNIISIDVRRLTTIQSFNIYGTLNKPSKEAKPQIKVPSVKLPTMLYDIRLKPGNKNTVVMSFDQGWQFSFRIHNARDIVEPSLKFDIRIEGIPYNINIKYNCNWQ